MKLTTRSTSFYPRGLRVVIHAYVPGFLELLVQRVLWHLVGVVVSVSSISVSPERGDSLEAVSPPCPSLSFYCFISVTGACFFSFSVGAHG